MPSFGRVALSLSSAQLSSMTRFVSDIQEARQVHEAAIEEHVAFRDMDPKPLTFHDSNLHSTTRLTSKRSPVCGSHTVLDIDMVSRLAIRSMSFFEFMKGPIGLLERNPWKVSSQNVSVVIELINLKVKAGK